MAVCLPDTQDDTPSIPIKLTRVGVTGVKKKLHIKINISFFTIQSFKKYLKK